MEDYSFLDSTDAEHFIYKVRARIFDKASGRRFIEELRKVPTSSDPMIEKGLVYCLIFVLRIYNNQVEYFSKNLNEKDWDELHGIMSDIHQEIERILSVKN